MIKKRYQVNLPEQQAECEANYYRLRRLLGDMSSLPVNDKRQYLAGSGPSNDTFITLWVTEQTKYTTLVHIVQGAALQKRVPYDKKPSTQKPQPHNLQEYSSCDNGSSDNNDCGQLTAQSPLCSDSISGAEDGSGYHSSYEAVVRVYHDAGLAEVVNCQHYRQFSARYEYPNEQMYQVDEKAQVNRFLSELLAHCLKHGRVNHYVISSQLTNKKYA